MIIIDYSQVCIAAMFANFQGNDQSLDYFRHLVLNSIRRIKTKFHNHGELVLAIDSKESWRKKVFPYYKANRAKSREESAIDWPLVYQNIAKIKDELDEFFPYKVIEIKGAEADDVIGTLVKHLNPEPVVIISADKDFIQMQRWPNVTQYDPIRDRYVEGNGSDYLFEHVIKGDSGDGIPSIRSGDAFLVEKIRQKPVTAKWIAELKAMNQTQLENHLKEAGILKYYERNKQIIDLDYTPADISEAIIAKYNAPVKSGDIYKYMIDNQLKILFDYINEF